MREVEAQRAAVAIPVNYGRERLFEYLLRRDGQAVGDVGRAVGDFEQMVAQRAAMLARATGPRLKLDTAEARIAFGTDDVALFHGVTCYASVSTSGGATLASGLLSESTCALRSAARSTREAASAGFDVSFANLSSVAACRV